MTTCPSCKIEYYKLWSSTSSSCYHCHQWINLNVHRKCKYCSRTRDPDGKFSCWPFCNYCVRYFSYCRVCQKNVTEEEIGTTERTTVCKECIGKCIKCMKIMPDITLENEMCQSCTRCLPCAHCKYKCCRECKKSRKRIEQAQQ